MHTARITTTLTAAAAAMTLAVWSGATASADGPSGERLVGRGAAVEPAYNADTGELMYLLTPVGAPFPAKANSRATSPLYMVVYPAGYGETLNCEGNPGNCPDHAGLAADVANQMEPTVYPDASLVPGHDHVADPPGAPDWNVAWEVIEVVFTPKAVADGAITHLRTDGDIEDAVAAGYARTMDLGVAFNCSVVSPTVYAHGTPITG